MVIDQTEAAVFSVLSKGVSSSFACQTSFLILHFAHPGNIIMCNPTLIASAAAQGVGAMIQNQAANRMTTVMQRALSILKE